MGNAQTLVFCFWLGSATSVRDRMIKFRDRRDEQCRFADDAG
jgi:hypothetical protein